MPQDSPPRILILAAEYYAEIAAELRAGAEAALTAAGARFDYVTVPGAFEIPAAIRLAVEAMRERPVRMAYHGFVALGCVIRGETSHYDLVCNECARGVQLLAVEHGLAIGFGVLTVENEAQALARARRSEKDKGGEAARACLRMIELRRHFELLEKSR